MSKNIDDLEKFFKGIDLPDNIDIAPHGVIFGTKEFIEKQIYLLRKQSGNKAYLPYYNRLLFLKEKLEKIC